MSSSIWTQCAERFEPQRVSGPAWRAVESQHVTSTRKLVDSDDEQQVLEALIDTACSVEIRIAPQRHERVEHGGPRAQGVATHEDLRDTGTVRSTHEVEAIVP